MNQLLPTPHQGVAPWCQLFDVLEDQILILDADSLHLTYANTAARQALALHLTNPDAPPWDLLERRYAGLTLKLQELLQEYADRIFQATPFELHFQHAVVQQQPSLFLDVSLSFHLIDQRALLLLKIKDLAEKAGLEDKLTKSYSLYQALANANKALLTASNELSLFQELCKVAMRAYTIRMAWIGKFQQGSLVQICHAGFEEGYLAEINLASLDLNQGTGPVTAALQERRVVFINNIEQDESFRPWRRAALARGYQSLAVIPIWDEQHIYGVLAVYSTRKDTFDPPLVGLLREIGSDISVALLNMRNNEQRLAVEVRLRQLSQAVEQSGSAVIITNLKGIVEYCNPKFYQITGYQSAEVLGRSLFFLKSTSTLEEVKRIHQTLLKGGSWTGELESLKKSGESFWSRQTVSPLRDTAGMITHFVVTAEDYTSLYHAQQMVQKLAYYDPLTSLPNRRLFIDRLSQACHAAKRYGQKLALLYLDLDGFKQVNDTLGHGAGDELLVEIAQRIARTVRESDTVARLGGDEFVILVNNLQDCERASAVARKVLDAIAEPISLRGFKVEVTTSLGITTYPEDGEDVDRLFRNADMAMYAAKSKGRNNFQFYTEAMNDRFVRKLALENRLRVAIEKEQFELHYQPQVDLCSGRLTGFEALVRWIDPEQGIIPPDEFIALAEETGLIVALGDMVLRMASRQARIFQAQGRQLKVAVNLSAYQFGRSDILLASLHRELDDEQLDPNFIELELTESTLIENIDETISVLKEFQRIGISVAIDDFGTGYSSLSYLKSLPINLLKIDRKFIRELPGDRDDAAITAAVIAMAHELGIRVLAEGVENEEQLEFLRRHRCDQAQGYLFSPPLPVSKLDAFITSYRPLA